MWRMAWEIKQNRANRSAILCAVIHASQHQDRSHRFHSECQRQKNRYCCNRSKTKKNTNHISNEHAEKAPHKIVRFKGNTEAVNEICKSSRNHCHTPRIIEKGILS